MLCFFEAELRQRTSSQPWKVSDGGHEVVVVRKVSCAFDRIQSAAEVMLLRLTPHHFPQLRKPPIQSSHVWDWAPQKLESQWRQFLEYPRCWKQVRPLFILAHTAMKTDRVVCIARELTIEAAQSAGNRGSKTDFSSRSYSPAHIKNLLDSRHDKEVLDGMRRVITVPDDLTRTTPLDYMANYYG